MIKNIQNVTINPGLPAEQAPSDEEKLEILMEYYADMASLPRHTIYTNRMKINAKQIEKVMHKLTNITNKYDVLVNNIVPIFMEATGLCMTESIVGKNIKIILWVKPEKERLEIGEIPIDISTIKEVLSYFVLADELFSISEIILELIFNNV